MQNKGKLTIMKYFRACVGSFLVYQICTAEEINERLCPGFVQSVLVKRLAKALIRGHQAAHIRRPVRLY